MSAQQFPARSAHHPVPVRPGPPPVAPTVSRRPRSALGTNLGVVRVSDGRARDPGAPLRRPGRIAPVTGAAPPGKLRARHAENRAATAVQQVNLRIRTPATPPTWCAAVGPRSASAPAPATTPDRAAHQAATRSTWSPAPTCSPGTRSVTGRYGGFKEFVLVDLGRCQVKWDGGGDRWRRRVSPGQIWSGRWCRVGSVDLRECGDLGRGGCLGEPSRVGRAGTPAIVAARWCWIPPGRCRCGR